MKMLLPFGALLAVLLACVEGRILQESKPDVPNSPSHAEPKCMEDLGCFPIGPDFFHPLYRPINLPPADREKINTKFLLYTLAHPKDAFPLRAKNDRLYNESGFDVNKKTKVIVHGWIDNQLFGEWMREMKDEFLLGGDLNVIIVDWSAGNSLPYTQATANTRVVGAEIAFLLQWLKDTKGLKLEDCHVLGHSLGGQIAGYAGERLKKLGRITSMDPAEPYFQNMPPSVRIDPTDADFVDVVHSDSKTILLGGLGMSQLAGHVDFFPNDGHTQPGCARERFLNFITEGIVGGARRFVACNHQRAVDFVMHSINEHMCTPVAYVCTSWADFQEGRCADCGPKGDRCAPMGDKAPNLYYPLRNDTRQQKFFLKTGSKAPYCLYHYQITLKLQRTSAAKDQEGTLQLTLSGENGEQKFDLADKKKTQLYPGSTYQFLITTDQRLGEIESVSFSWTSSSLLSIIRTYSIYLENIKVVPMNAIEPSVRTAQTRNYCATKRGELKSKAQITLQKSDIC